MKVVDFPSPPVASNVAEALRMMADRIESGEYDEAHSLAWVINCGDGRIEVGLLGRAAEPALAAHYLLCLAQRKLENVG